MTAALCGVSLYRRRSAATKPYKAPRVGIDDAPRSVAADIVAGGQPVTSTIAYGQEVSLQGALTASGSGSSHGDESAQVEEELSLILAGMLPPHYKELVLASIHLASLRFHEGERYYFQKKLLE